MGLYSDQQLGCHGKKRTLPAAYEMLFQIWPLRLMIWFLKVIRWFGFESLSALTKASWWASHLPTNESNLTGSIFTDSKTANWWNARVKGIGLNWWANSVPALSQNDPVDAYAQKNSIKVNIIIKNLVIRLRISFRFARQGQPEKESNSQYR